MALLERSKHFQLKDPRSREHAKRTTLSMINAERYCTFVKVIRPLSPEARPRSCRRAPLLCLPLFHGRKRWGRVGWGGSCYTSAHVVIGPPGCAEPIQGRLLTTSASAAPFEGPGGRRRSRSGLYVASPKKKYTKPPA